MHTVTVLNSFRSVSGYFYLTIMYKLCFSLNKRKIISSLPPYVCKWEGSFNLWNWEVLKRSDSWVHRSQVKWIYAHLCSLGCIQPDLRWITSSNLPHSFDVILPPTVYCFWGILVYSEPLIHWATQLLPLYNSGGGVVSHREIIKIISFITLHFSFLKCISAFLFVRKHLSLLLSRLGSLVFSQVPTVKSWFVEGGKCFFQKQSPIN